MPTTIDLQTPPRDGHGRYVPGAFATYRAQTADERRRRAKEWKKFRENFLFSQEALADMLQCNRRTVTSVEAGAVIPSLRIQRAFRDLVREQKRRVA